MRLAAGFARGRRQTTLQHLLTTASAQSFGQEGRDESMFEGQFSGSMPVGEAPVIYVVDDEAGVRMALVHALEDRGCSVWSFSSGPDLLAALDTIEPGCLLIDICMPFMNGLALMQELAARGCDWPVIAMTGDGDIPTAVAAMKLGAMEFVEKPFGRNVLDEAVVRGFARLALTENQRRTRETMRAMLGRLTPREVGVLRELMTGEPNKVVAHRLGLSVRTVEMHRANLLAKLEMRSVQQATALLARALDEFAASEASLAVSTARYRNFHS